MTDIAFCSLVNDREQFARCQASLRAIATPFPQWVMVEPNRHGWNAAQGLNHGVAEADAEWVVCVHQDVLFPPDFWRRFTAALAATARDTALVGIVGCERNGKFRGHIHDPNGHCYWAALPRRVLALDEVLIAVRKSTGIRFDEAVPGFHCYGADLCFEADARGLGIEVVDAPLVHLSTGRLDEHYERASDWLMAKWGGRLGHLLPTPALLLQDQAKASFWRRLWVRWLRRGDRLSRNRNVCPAGDGCAVRELGQQAFVGGRG